MFAGAAQAWDGMDHGNRHGGGNYGGGSYSDRGGSFMPGDYFPSRHGGDYDDSYRPRRPLIIIGGYGGGHRDRWPQDDYRPNRHGDDSYRPNRHDDDSYRPDRPNRPGSYDSANNGGWNDTPRPNRPDSQSNGGWNDTPRPPRPNQSNGGGTDGWNGQKKDDRCSSYGAGTIDHPCP
jgi:hypothetical protein